jgi:hypothetical protein
LADLVKILVKTWQRKNHEYPFREP